MKLKIFLMALCLLAGMGISKVNAQSENAAQQGWFTSSAYWTPIFCDGVLVDILEGGDLVIHYVWKPTKGFEIDQLKGEVTSNITGETFTIHEVDKWFWDGYWTATWKYNLVGDMGTHYIGTLYANYSTGTLTIGKTICK